MLTFYKLAQQLVLTPVELLADLDRFLFIPHGQFWRNLQAPSAQPLKTIFCVHTDQMLEIYSTMNQG